MRGGGSAHLEGEGREKNGKKDRKERGNKNEVTDIEGELAKRASHREAKNHHVSLWSDKAAAEGRKGDPPWRVGREKIGQGRLGG